jgi:ATP-dependent DNA helicase RecG
MNLKSLVSQVELGEDSSRQFKIDVRSADSLASEMAAFANSEGGTIFIGVADNGVLSGLSSEDVSRLNQLISNAASQLVRSPLSVKTENVALKNKRIVIVLYIPKGIDKPYFDKNGVIWLKAGADKRRVNSKEELRRLFQTLPQQDLRKIAPARRCDEDSTSCTARRDNEAGLFCVSPNQFHADELPTNAGIDKLDALRFRDFLRDIYKQEYPASTVDLTRLLQNMNLATPEGLLNLAGVLMFSEHPEWIKPQFVIKAIHYPGNEIHLNEYLDTEDFSGPLPKVFNDALSFVMRNLHKIQAGRGVNSPGLPEIPEIVFEELLVNALVHRDYLISAPIRLFIFDNRIEIISPGHLPNNLNVQKVLAGNANIRNPILMSYVAKGLLPFHGLGSGIQRALAHWPHIEFVDDREGCLFKVTIQRKAVGQLGQKVADPSSSQNKVTVTEFIAADLLSDPISDLLNHLRRNPLADYQTLAEFLGVSEATIKRMIQKLKQQQKLQRVGSRKSGRWEVLG